MRITLLRGLASGLAALLFAFSSAIAIAQSGGSGIEDYPQPQGGIPIPYGEELDSTPPTRLVPGIFAGGFADETLQHGPYCCEEERWADEDQAPQPRTGPQYEYQNIGEPWDSHARLLRAGDERRDAEQNLDRRNDEYSDAAHQRDVYEMYGDQWGPDPLDENGYEVDEDYLHARANRDAAEDRYDRATDEEDSAAAANDAAVAEYQHWEASQPRREYPPYEGQPVKELLPEPENSGLQLPTVAELHRSFENSARNDYYETLNRHADGEASIEEVEEAYRELRMYTR
jgi:hypothetical protein